MNQPSSSSTTTTAYGVSTPGFGARCTVVIVCTTPRPLLRTQLRLCDVQNGHTSAGLNTCREQSSQRWTRNSPTAPPAQCGPETAVGRGGGPYGNPVTSTPRCARRPRDRAG